LTQYSLSHFLCTASPHVCSNLTSQALENGIKIKAGDGGDRGIENHKLRTVNCPIALRCASNRSSISCVVSSTPLRWIIDFLLAIRTA